MDAKHAGAGLALTAGLALVVMGCSPKAVDEIESHVLKGVVRNEAGAPLAGAEVFADNTMEYNSNTLGVSDAKGEFRIKLDEARATSYRAGAHLLVTWDDQDWRLSLQPDSDAPFAGAEGAVRNFTWRLSGKDRDGTTYGSTIWVYRDLDDPELDQERIEVTFTPAGPRIDGSAGAPFTMRLAEQQELQTAPLGRYTVTARDVGEAPKPLKVRVRNTGAFAASVEAGFVSQSSHGLMELEVSSL